jgi:predicted RNA-binding protein with PUA domain
MKFRVTYNFDHPKEIETINNLNLTVDQRVRQLEIIDAFVTENYEKCYVLMNQLPHDDKSDELMFVSQFIIGLVLEKRESGKIVNIEKLN